MELEVTYSCLSTSTIYTTMHSFTIALISTLSLGVHAASIGDPVSQLVTREQHNRLFHNPDFTSANLPAAEPLERAEKISPRKVALDATGSTRLSGTFTDFLNGITSALPTESNTAQGVPNTLSPAAIGLVSGGNTGLDIFGPQTISGSLVDNLKVAIDGNTTPTDDIQAILSNVEAIIALLAQDIARAQLVVNSGDNVLLAAILAQAALRVDSMFAANARVAQVAQAAVNTCLGANFVASNAAVANLGARREDAEKRQLSGSNIIMGAVSAVSPTFSPVTNSVGTVVTREDNVNFFLDEDMKANEWRRASE